MERAGAVLLSASGARIRLNVVNVGTDGNGFYWSSQPSEKLELDAQSVFFDNSLLEFDNNYHSSQGVVRLVKDAN